MAERQALGRGLSALITPSERRPNDVRALPIKDLHKNASQPRKHFDDGAIAELAASIREKGLLQPIVVRRVRIGYEIIVGERRWRAAREAGLETVPAIVREATDRESLELALVENIQREDLNPIELATAYQGLMNLNGLTQEEVAGHLGVDRATVANIIRLLALPREIQQDVAEGRLSMGHARALLGCGTAVRQAALRERIIREGLSVRVVERLIRDAKDARPRRATSGAQTDPALAPAEEALKRHFQTPVSIKQHGKKGRLEIKFFSNEDLNRILRMILG